MKKCILAFMLILSLVLCGCRSNLASDDNNDPSYAGSGGFRPYTCAVFNDTLFYTRETLKSDHSEYDIMCIDLNANSLDEAELFVKNARLRFLRHNLLFVYSTESSQTLYYDLSAAEQGPKILGSGLCFADANEKNIYYQGSSLDNLNWIDIETGKAGTVILEDPANTQLFFSDGRIFIFDITNKAIYPLDENKEIGSAIVENLGIEDEYASYMPFAASGQKIIYCFNYSGSDKHSADIMVKDLTDGSVTTLISDDIYVYSIESVDDFAYIKYIKDNVYYLAKYQFSASALETVQFSSFDFSHQYLFKLKSGHAVSYYPLSDTGGNGAVFDINGDIIKTDDYSEIPQKIDYWGDLYITDKYAVSASDFQIVVFNVDDKSIKNIIT